MGGCGWRVRQPDLDLGAPGEWGGDRREVEGESPRVEGVFATCLGARGYATEFDKLPLW